jgi:hypothetical protein
MRGQPSKLAEPSLDHTRAALRRPRAVLGLIAVALLVGPADPAIAGTPGDLILNEFNAVGATMLLQGKSFTPSGIDVDDNEVTLGGGQEHGYYDQKGPVQLTIPCASPCTPPGGLFLDTDYYIVTTGLVNDPSEWFGLSLTPGGAKVDITSQTGAPYYTVHPGDTYFGFVEGNGGNWLELVVIADHLDIRGWTLEWHNSDPPPPPSTNCNFGTVVFEAQDIWSDLRKGTIITVAEELDDDTSYDPAGGDWWINANHEQVAVSHTICFKVDNDSWRMRIWDGAITCTDPEDPPVVCTGVGSTVVIQDWVGEGQALWGGGGVGNDEVGKLEQDPSAAAATSPPVPMYNDGGSSSFGSENLWSQGTMKQSFYALRGVLGIPAPGLTLKGAALLAALLVVCVFWLFGRQRGSGV